jgi:dTDP-4-amino-4,6-dideoxygalactose transaminase
MTKKEVKVLIPRMPSRQDLEKYLDRIDETKQYSNFGPLERELRQRFSAFWQTPIERIVTVCNATLGLQGAIETAPGKFNPWEVPAWTFIATPLALHHANVDFKFVDSSLESWRAEFSSSVKNIVDVLPFGDNLNLERLEKSGVEVAVVDAAASGLTLLNQLPSSPIKFGLVISLHATKLIPAGEGAIFVTNCEDWAERYSRWTNFGFNASRESDMIGINAKLSEYSSAVALASLDGLSETSKLIRNVHERVLRITGELNLNVHPAMRAGRLTPYWIADFKSAETKVMVKQCFESLNIQTRDWWGNGCHRYPFFSYTGTPLPNTDCLAQNTLGLPMHPFLTNEELRRIETALKSII